MISSNSTSTMVSSDGLPEPWYEFKDEKTGEPYYYNTETKETTWQCPAINEESTTTNFLDDENHEFYTAMRSKDLEIEELKRKLAYEKSKVKKVIQESEKVVMQSLSEQAGQLQQIEELTAQIEQLNVERDLNARRVLIAEQRSSQLETQLVYLREEIETERSNAKDAMTCLSRLQRRQKILLRERSMS